MAIPPRPAPQPPQKIRTTPGRPLPLGATVMVGSINFALFCRQATHVALLVFNPKAKEVSYTFTLSPSLHRTGDIWHVEIHGLPQGCTYAYQISGQDQSSRRGPKQMVVLDPYAKQISGGEGWGHAVSGEWRCGLPADDDFDWQGDQP